MKKDKPGLAIIIAEKLKGKEDKPERKDEYQDEKVELAEKMMEAEDPIEFAKALQSFIRLCK